MSNTPQIISFVKGTLGCQCPEEVFSQVDSQENCRLNIDLWLRSKINVGNRLLVYVVEAVNTAFVHDNLLTLIFIGRDEKELKGFKTFRLVLAADAVADIKAVAEDIFNDLHNVMDLGDSIHLHVVGREEISW
jgi:hypothetical protein